MHYTLRGLVLFVLLNAASLRVSLDSLHPKCHPESTGSIRVRSAQEPYERFVFLAEFLNK